MVRLAEGGTRLRWNSEHQLRQSTPPLSVSGFECRVGRNLMAALYKYASQAGFDRSQLVSALYDILIYTIQMILLGPTDHMTRSQSRGTFWGKFPLL